MSNPYLYTHVYDDRVCVRIDESANRGAGLWVDVDTGVPCDSSHYEVPEDGPR